MEGTGRRRQGRQWPTGQGGKGNEGVAAYVGQLKNSIGYVEYAYAKQNKLAWTQLQNKAGKFVQPEQKAFAAAAANADWKSAPGMGVVLTDEPGADSWPVTAATFILVHKSQDKPVQGKAVLDFFDWAFKNGAKSAEGMDYVPLRSRDQGNPRRLGRSQVRRRQGRLEVSRSKAGARARLPCPGPARGGRGQGGLARHPVFPLALRKVHP